MAKAAKWKHFSAMVNPTNNLYNRFHKKFRHLGTLDTVQIQEEVNISPAYEDAIEDYIAAIRKRSDGLIDATITQSSYVQEEDGYDPYWEAEVTISGWRDELTEPEQKAVKEYFATNSLGKLDVNPRFIELSFPVPSVQKVNVAILCYPQQ